MLSQRTTSSAWPRYSTPNLPPAARPGDCWIITFPNPQHMLQFKNMMPERIGRYEIKSELGRGGMASVYHAHDPRFKRDVAIKVLPPQFMHDPTFRARFEREAQTIASIEHPAIVPVYDFGEENGIPYLVMRYMPGGSLADLLKNGPLSLTETARIIARLAPALDEIHVRGIIHRDLKPANILFDQYGNACLSDFGIARLSEATTTLTGEAIIGTPSYMSPEQARGDRDIDGRSDIYALGAILFEMLTGKQPYEATTPMGIAMKQITEPVPRIREVRADLPPGCEDLITKAMAKNRDERFRTARDLA
ncbi:MAG: serine/threonine protein kinase, partial [Chloroflexota bacterium]